MISRRSKLNPKRKPRQRLLPRLLRATRAGWCFIAIIFGVGFAALNTGNNLLYLVLALLLAFLVLSGLLSEASLRGLRVERRLPHELFAATPTRVSLRIYNHHRRNPSFAISIEDRFEGANGAEFAGRTFALRVGLDESVDRSYVFEPEQRGELKFVDCRLSTRFPFGLFVKSVDLNVESEALVYPAIRQVATDGSNTEAYNDGDEAKFASSDGDEISDVRDYVNGDSVQRVHWRRSLRERRLIVGEREGEASAEIEVFLQLSESLTATEIESRISDAASRIVRHLGHGDRVGLRTSQMRFEPATGNQQRTALLSHLALIAADTPESDALTPPESKVPESRETLRDPRDKPSQPAQAAR